MRAPASLDLVITDLAMPGMDGLTLAREIQSRRPGLSIVLLTGFCDGVSGEEAKKHGICDVVLKPPIAGELIKTITSHLK